MLSDRLTSELQIFPHGRLSLFAFISLIVIFANISAGPVTSKSSQVRSSVSNPYLYKVKIEHGQRRTSSGALRSYVLYIPQNSMAAPKLPAPPYPVVVMVHGFLMSSNQQKYTCQFLAERGFVVLAPNMSKIMLGSEKRTKNVEDVVDQTAWLIEQSKTAGSPFFGLCDPQRMAIAGNSSGGAICFESVLQAQKIKLPFHSMCSLEGVPWDRTLSLVKDIQPMNILTLRAESCLCNYHWNVLKYSQLLTFPTDDVKVNGAHHCDAENPTSIGCMSVCGSSHEKYRRLFKIITYLYLRDTLNAPKLYETKKSFVDFIAGLQKEGKVQAHLNNLQSNKLSNNLNQTDTLVEK